MVEVSCSSRFISTPFGSSHSAPQKQLFNYICCVVTNYKPGGDVKTSNTAAKNITAIFSLTVNNMWHTHTTCQTTGPASTHTQLVKLLDQRLHTHQHATRHGCCFTGFSGVHPIIEAIREPWRRVTSHNRSHQRYDVTLGTWDGSEPRWRPVPDVSERAQWVVWWVTGRPSLLSLHAASHLRVRACQILQSKSAPLSLLRNDMLTLVKRRERERELWNWLLRRLYDTL